MAQIDCRDKPKFDEDDLKFWKTLKLSSRTILSDSVELYLSSGDEQVQTFFKNVIPTTRKYIERCQDKAKTFIIQSQIKVNLGKNFALTHLKKTENLYDIMID